MQEEEGVWAGGGGQEAARAARGRSEGARRAGATPTRAREEEVQAAERAFCEAIELLEMSSSAARFASFEASAAVLSMMKPPLLPGGMVRRRCRRDVPGRMRKFLPRAG